MRRKGTKRGRSKLGGRPKGRLRASGGVGAIFASGKTKVKPGSIVHPLAASPIGLLSIGSGLPIVVEDPSDSNQTSTERLSQEAIREMPGWAISLGVHVLLFLILAIWSMGSGLDDDRIVLEISSSGEDIDSREMEVEVGGGADSQAEAEDTDESMAESEEEEAAVPTDPTNADSVEKASLDDPSETGSKDLDGNAQNDGSIATGESDAVGEGNGTEFFGAKSSGSRFVFVVDCSGSMKTDGRWERAVAELSAAIEGMDEKKEFLVLLYHSDSVAMLHMKIQDADLIPATPGNKARFFDWLKMQSPVGRTRPARSMEIALSRTPDAIFFLSDGEFKDDTVSVIAACNQPHETRDGTRRKTSINTFFLGTDAARATMEGIAEENNGIFTWVK